MSTFAWRLLAALVLILLLVAGLLGLGCWYTEQQISRYHQQVAAFAHQNPPAAPPAQDFAQLPAPVQRYLRFALPAPDQAMRAVTMTFSGQFRRPLTDSFHPTQAEQTAALYVPALSFSATTQMPAGLWARAYDVYINGRMSMRAKVASLLTVVDAEESSRLDQSSLQRWLIESPLYPQALQPGGAVQWQAIDDRHARATVRWGGHQASLVASFNADDSLLAFEAEQDGDLTTPYHGAGEYAERSHYQLVQGVRIPMRFTLARMAKGQKAIFWHGVVTHIQLQP